MGGIVRAVRVRFRLTVIGRPGTKNIFRLIIGEDVKRSKLGGGYSSAIVWSVGGRLRRPTARNWYVVWNVALTGIGI